MVHYWVLLVLWATFANLTLALTMTREDMEKISAKFCGSHLADTLSMVCDGVYNSKQKKGMYTNELNAREDYEDVEASEYTEDTFLPFPFRSKQRAKALISQDFRKREDIRIVDECCQKSCSLWEMTSYCGK